MDLREKKLQGEYTGTQQSDTIRLLSQKIKGGYTDRQTAR
jgi:hypothetical protein